MTGTVAYIQNTLKDYYPPSEIKAFIRLIMERVCDIQPHQFLPVSYTHLTLPTTERV